MHVDVFVDTNILVYAHDREAGTKHLKARDLIGTFWQNREIPCISVQVLQELHVNLARKGVSQEVSSEIVTRYLSWRVVDNTRQVFRQALSVQQRWQISFWDSLILAAAQRAGISTVWSEDLSSSQDYGGVRVTNPLQT